MPGFIGIDLQGDKEIIKALDGLADDVKDAAVDDISDYLIRVLRSYVPQKSVTRKQAYPNMSFTTSTGKVVTGWASKKQLNYFFAALADGRIKVPYHRTQEMSRGWKQLGRGYNSLIVNEVEHAAWVYGDPNQANMMKLIGWKTLPAILKERAQKIQDVLLAAVKKVLRKRKLG